MNLQGNKSKTESKELSRSERQRFYQTAAWRRVRRRVLAMQPLCRACLKQARMTPAKICDHISPLWDDFQGFLKGPFQGLCRPCHAEKLEADLTARRKARLMEARPYA